MVCSVGKNMQMLFVSVGILLNCKIYRYSMCTYMCMVQVENFRQINCMNKIIHQNVNSNVANLEKGIPGSAKREESILIVLAG